MSNIKTFLKQLQQHEPQVYERLGLKSRHALYVESGRGGFPPAWFLVINDAAKQHGLEAKPEYFKFKGLNEQDQ